MREKKKGKETLLKQINRGRCDGTERMEVAEKDSLDERESGRESCNLSGKDRREREAEREEG